MSSNLVNELTRVDIAGRHLVEKRAVKIPISMAPMHAQKANGRGTSPRERGTDTGGLLARR